MNTYILSNINMNSLKFYLKDYKFVDSCSYGNYLIDLIDESSPLYVNDIDLVILFLDGEELKKQYNLDEVFLAVESFLKKKNVIFLISTIVLKPSYIDTYMNDTFYFELDVNKKIIDFQRKNSLLLLDFHRLVLQYGADNIYDEKFWYLGRIKYKKLAFEEISLDILNIVKTYKGQIKKVLVLDLDNTLWGGVIGEDGENIKLSNESEGKIYLDFQENVKYLKSIGILLAINSKNNFDDAMEGLNHSFSVLKKNDFVIIKANWNDKVTNLKEIAQELNLGLDSLVFIDDNAVERELVQEYLPEVIVPEFPKDINSYNKWFVEDVVYKFFSKIKLTNEDLNKSKQYEANKQRKTLEFKSLDLNDFLVSLNIKISFFINDIQFIDRYAQMTQKTNQFNLTTKRYAVKDIKKFIQSDEFIVYAIGYEDKFLKEGVIGLVILKLEGNKAIIDTFLLSCRVLNRGVEKKLFAIISKDLKNHNINRIIGLYYPTKKNIIVKNLYTEHGFKKLDENIYEKEV